MRLLNIEVVETEQKTDILEILAFHCVGYFLAPSGAEEVVLKLLHGEMWLLPEVHIFFATWPEKWKMKKVVQSSFLLSCSGPIRK